MDAADWDFLAPWLHILSLVAFQPEVNQTSNGSDRDDEGSLQSRVRYLRIEPHTLILLNAITPPVEPGRVKDLMRLCGCAMELVALALRVEPRVWGLIRGLKGTPLLDMTAHDPQQLGAGLLVRCGGVGDWVEKYAALFRSRDCDVVYHNGRPLPFKRDRERLRRMVSDCLGSSPHEYRIPLAIRIGRYQNTAIPFRVVADFFERVAVAMVTDTDAPSQPDCTPYRLEDVIIDGCDGAQTEIKRLKRAGVYVTAINEARSMSHEALQAVIAARPSQPLQALNIRVTSTQGVARLYSALSRGQSVGAMRVQVSLAREHLSSLVHVLLLTNSEYSALHSLRIETTDESVDLQMCEALTTAIDEVLRGPRRYARYLEEPFHLPVLGNGDIRESMSILLPTGEVLEVSSRFFELFDEADTSETLWTTSSSIETFSLKANAADKQTAMAIVNLLQRCLPRSLKTLTLEIGALDDACLCVILESFPELKTLRIKDASVTTTEPLLDAYKSGSCKIEALELGAYGLEVGGLLSALADASTTVAKTLKQLQLNCPYDDEPREEFLSALKKMLRADQSLEFVKICKVGQEDKAEIDAQLSEFRRAALSSQRRLALLSVIRRTSMDATKGALGSLTADAVDEIMAMAERPRPRLVCIE